MNWSRGTNPTGTSYITQTETPSNQNIVYLVTNSSFSRSLLLPPTDSRHDKPQNVRFSYMKNISVIYHTRRCSVIVSIYADLQTNLSRLPTLLLPSGTNPHVFLSSGSLFYAPILVWISPFSSFTESTLYFIRELDWIHIILAESILPTVLINHKTAQFISIDQYQI